MKSKKFNLSRLLVLVVLFGTFACAEKTEKLPWRTLFNGENMDAWEMKGGQGVVEIIDSVIVCHMVANTQEHAFVTTRERFGDFILEMDIKTDSAYNSGIILRCQDAPENCDTCHVSLYGYQVKLDSRLERRWTGGVFYDYGKEWHWLYSLENDERARYAHKVAQWNHFRMEAIGNSIKVWVNDVPVTNMLNNDFSEGYIAIKIHYLKQNDVSREKHLGRYKNIRIITENPQEYATTMDIPAREVR